MGKRFGANIDATTATTNTNTTEKPLDPAPAPPLGAICLMGNKDATMGKRRAVCSSHLSHGHVAWNVTD